MSQIEDLKAMLSAGDMSVLPVEDQRNIYDGLADLMPHDKSVRRQRETIAGVPCEWYGDEGSVDDGVIMYLHGGGYAIGSLKSHEPLYADLCKHSGLKVLAVDYRLAPENPFPAAIDDVLSVYESLLEKGYSANRIAIAGDSAGGGLSTALLLSIRDKALALPLAAVLISPWVDLSMSGESIKTKAELDPVVTLQGLEEMAKHYCGNKDKTGPLVSPLFADLSGLPPVLIHVGSDEILLDDSLRLYKKLKEAGVDVQCKEFPEMVHVFHHFAAMLDQGKDALAEIADFLQNKLN
jgi:acetyl esterase/lipase